MAIDKENNHARLNVVVFFFFIILLLIIAVILRFNSYDTIEESSLQEIQDTTVNEKKALSPDKDHLLIITGEYPPYVTESLEEGGIHLKVVEAVLDVMDLDYEIAYYPWARGLKMVENGEAFATFPWSFSEDRVGKYVFSEPLLDESEESFAMFYYRPNHEELDLEDQKIEAFQDYRIGGLLDYFYIPLFRNASIELDMSAEEVELFDKLRSGRIDIAPIDKRVALYILNTYYSEDVANFAYFDVPFLQREYNYSMMLDVNNVYAQWFIDIFNEGLVKIRENGTYDQIVNEDPYLK